MQNIKILFIIIIIIIILQLKISPSLDKEGYYRNPSLWALIFPQLEGSYRASIIKSIQTGTLTMSAVQTTNTATITSVDVNNSMLTISWNTEGTNSSSSAPGVTITNSTTLTATRPAHQGSTLDTTYTVTEFYSNVLKSAVQSFTISMGGGVSSGTATITAVATTKTAVISNGFTNDTALAFRPDYTITSLILTNGTTVTATRNMTTGTTVAYGMAVEFK